MSRLKSGYLLAAAACVVLSGCGKKEPTGQVVATLDGKEITAIDLSNEMQGFTAPNPQIRKQAERQALTSILNRKAIAAAAKEAGIDKTPGFAQQQQRVNEALLVQSWQASIAKSVPPPSKEEVDRFIAAHPDVYANHKIYEVEQIRMPRVNDPKLIADLRPLDTMESVGALLTERKVPFRVAADRIDTLGIDPEIVNQIAKLPPGEIFVIPAGNMLAVNRIVNTTVTPTPPDVATKHATQYLKNQRTQQAIARQFQSVIAAAQKDVKYSKAFEPPPAKAPAAKAAASKAPAAAPAKAP